MQAAGKAREPAGLSPRATVAGATLDQIAAEVGLPISYVDTLAFTSASSGCKLSDDELDAVAGGDGWYNDSPPQNVCTMMGTVCLFGDS